MPFSWEESGAGRGDKDLQGNTTNTHTGGKEQLPGFADTWGKGQSWSNGTANNSIFDGENKKVDWGKEVDTVIFEEVNKLLNGKRKS